MQSIQSLVETYSYWDIGILVLLIVGSLIYSFVVSRGQVVSVLVATCMAYTLVHLAPFFNESFVGQIVFFAVLFLLVLFLLSRTILQSPVGIEVFGFIGVFLLSLMQIGFLIAVFVSFLPDIVHAEFTTFTSMIFVGETPLFVWAALPVLSFMIIGYRIDRNFEAWEDEDEDE